MRRALLSVALGLLTACNFKFDAQTIHVVADPEHDRVDVLLVYRGLWVDDAPGKQLAALDKVLAQRSIMVLDSWPFALSLSEPPAEAAQAARHFTMEQGPLFLDEAGRPGFYQLVRIQGVRELMALLNDTIRAGIAGELQKDGKLFDRPMDPRTRELLEAAIRDRHSFVEKRGAALVLVLPCSDDFHRGLRRAMLQELLESAVNDAFKHQGGAADPPRVTAADILAAPGLRFLVENEWAISRVGDRTHVSVGIPGAREHVFVKPPPPTGHDGLLDALKAAGRGALPELKAAALEQRFREFVQAGTRPASRPAK